MEKSSKNQIMWILITLAVFFIFRQFTPLWLYFNYDFAVSITESIILMIFLSLTFLNVSYDKETKEIGNRTLKESNVYIYAIIFGIIVFCGIFFEFYKNKIEKALKNDGKFITATVTDGLHKAKKSLMGTRNSESFDITVSYLDSLSGNQIEEKTSVSKEIFDAVGIGQEIEILYLPEIPNIFRVIIGKENVLKYKNIDERNFKYDDLGKFFESFNNNSQLEYLKTISQGWEKSKNENLNFYMNNSRKESVGFASKDKILYEGNLFVEFTPKQKILSTKDISSKNEPNITKVTYETDLYFIEKNTEADVNNTVNSKVFYYISKKN